jgi:hypothetical protein
MLKGLNGAVAATGAILSFGALIGLLAVDDLECGTVQDSVDEITDGPRDVPYWTVPTTHIKDLHVLIYGDGRSRE